MIKHCVIVILVLTSIPMRSQIFPPDAKGVQFFTEGIESMKAEQYQVADSLFTLALGSYKNGNVYFNWAFSRIMMNDTIGFCEDIGSASIRYFDPEAEKYYHSICCSSVDTIYYDRKKKIVTTGDSYRYYEVIKKIKYVPKIVGTFHDRKSSNTTMSVDYGNDDQFIGAYGKQTDIIAAYIIDKHGKHYYKTTKRPSIIDMGIYNDLMKRAKKYLNIKYGYLKEQNAGEPLKIYFKIYFNTSGRVTSSEYLGFYPEINLESETDDLKALLLDIANSYPEVKPAKFFKVNVPSAAYDFIEF